MIHTYRHGTVAVSTVLFPKRHHVIFRRRREPDIVSMNHGQRECAVGGIRGNRREGTVMGTGTSRTGMRGAAWKSEETGTLTHATRAQGCLKVQGRKKKKMTRQGPNRSQNTAGRRKTKGEGHTRVCSGPLTEPYVVVVGAARTRCYRKRTIAPSS